jgi:hypothetical protein
MKAVITSFGLLVLPMVAPSQPIDKCGTVAILEGRFKSLRDFGDRRAQTQALLVSPSGKFRLNYDTAGPNAVPLEDLNGNGIPDYVERAAQYADESWQLQVSEQGFRDPVGSVPYDIFFEEMGFYGYTEAVGDGRTFIVLHRNFSRFPPNTDPEGSVLGALKVTIAHEFKHAVQYATNQWLGDAGRVAWVEMDATMMEEIQYPQVNDYWNYLQSNSIFTDPNGSTPGSYHHATWMLQFAESLGIGYWRDVWETVGQNRTNMFAAIQANLVPREVPYVAAFTLNHMWHFASGTFARDGFGFEDRYQYPTPSVVPRVAVLDSLSTSATVSRNAARYFRFDRAPDASGRIQLSLNHTLPRIGIGLLAYGTDGRLRTMRKTGDESGTLLLQTDWLWEDIAFLGMVVANATEFATLSFSYRFERDQVPEQAELRPNVPNPFRSTTRIDFALPERQHVRLTVYDPIGREIAVLVDGERDSGRHSVRFNARNMASGVYVVRLQTSAGGTVRLISLVR